MPMTIYGREAWCLQSLIDAGKRGCTPIDRPAPRWSAYVHDLRHDFGIIIETIHEDHGGQFSGTHARYVLHSDVTILEQEGLTR
ncbi:winged helix domain-containing protein [Mesorhizobium sp. L-8-3]|uniref:winged helix domain-containing protein n=1 Tax=Mesorhizobium sp. L-8-3 TaxID=2744522 RepID=UPI001FD2EDC6|nr:hypothetical protein [Mesorhizobium sp. L-8-3]